MINSFVFVIAKFVEYYTEFNMFQITANRMWGELLLIVSQYQFCCQLV